MAEDTMASQTGQTIAALLNLPCASSVIEAELQPDQKEITVEREIEGGNREVVRLRMPVVLTIQPGINFPRYPSFSKVMRARTHAQERIRAEDLAIEGSRESCRRVRLPEPVSPGVFLEGTSREKAQALIRILHEKSLLV
jgi:electron transfer flavoprotein alpha/beta subunit